METIWTVFDDMPQAFEAEIARLLPKVSAARRRQALAFKFPAGQFACLKSYEMLHRLLEAQGVVEPGEELEFEMGEHGKPFLKRPGVHFNLSHCPPAIAVMVGAQPVGIDVERFVRTDRDLVRYSMSPAEERQIADSACPERTFSLLWTRKEALLKCHGTGITDHLKECLDNLVTDFDESFSGADPESSATPLDGTESSSESPQILGALSENTGQDYPVTKSIFGALPGNTCKSQPGTGLRKVWAGHGQGLRLESYVNEEKRYTLSLCRQI